ncbi:YciI family protein [Planktomarina temperata]|nr:YciI family protein [Planktomarina temperata]MDC1526870.1 YciI family protein [Planktomarina temperata]
MRIAVITRDKPGHLHLRVETRDAHLAYIKETGIVEMAGPFLDNAEQMCGSLIVLEVENMAAAQAWAENDPYNKAGLFESVTLSQWKKVIG